LAKAVRVKNLVVIDKPEFDYYGFYGYACWAFTNESASQSTLLKKQSNTFPKTKFMKSILVSLRKLSISNVGSLAELQSILSHLIQLEHLEINDSLTIRNNEMLNLRNIKVNIIF
jgi:hypothetical protein